MVDPHAPIPFPDREPAESTASPELSPAERLRAFEDKHIGADHSRVNGDIQRGHGSKFRELSPTHRAHHAALEHLVAAHSEHSKAEAAVAAAAEKLVAAERRAAETEPHED